MWKDWSSIKTQSKVWPTLEVGGVIWRVVDEIVMLDKASEAKHAFAIVGAQDAYPLRATLRYPDGTSVTDTGHAQLEGSFTFTALGLTPGRPVVIVCRIDYIMGNYKLAVLVDDKPAGEVVCEGADRSHRWRNWLIEIAAAHVTAPTMNVRLTSLTPGRDVHMFHTWIYQP